MSYLIEIPCFSESDGSLGTFEPDTIPGFQINRVFYVFDVPSDKSRADHACMNAKVLFVAIAGSIRLSLETEGEVEEYYLNNKCKALVVPEASWIKAFDFSSDAVSNGFFQ